MQFLIEVFYYSFNFEQNQAAKIENAANRNTEREQKMAGAGVDQQKQHYSQAEGVATGRGVGHFVSSFQVL